MDEYVDEDRYFVREHVYSLKRLQYERRIAGNASGCLQYTERGSERLCEYVPGGVGNTLANVIAYISEGFQQGDVVSAMAAGLHRFRCSNTVGSHIGSIDSCAITF